MKKGVVAGCQVVDVKVSLVDGTRLKGLLQLPRERTLRDVMNGGDPFIEFHCQDNGPTVLSKQSILSLRPFRLPPADQLKRRQEFLDQIGAEKSGGSLCPALDKNPLRVAICDVGRFFQGRPAFRGNTASQEPALRTARFEPLQPHVETDEDTVSPGPQGQETILVVEDDPNVRAVAVNILEGLGYQVRQAEDGRTALGILELPGKSDLLFTDLVMPNGIGGQDLLRRTRELRPGLNALFTTGYSEQFIKDKGGNDRDVAVLSKPYRRDKLAGAVRAALTGKS